jgi:predicted O-methyltransferase YrrM
VSCKTTFRSELPDDDRLFREPLRGDLVLKVPAQLAIRERLYLYATVFALAPARSLEVGVAQGGSSMLIHAALSDLSHGHLVSIDPDPDLSFDWKCLADRATLLVGESPRDLGTAMRIAGGPFEFVFLDANHLRDPVRDDLRGLVDVTAPGGLILCHDAFHGGVARGIADALELGLPLRDAGIVSRTRNDGQENGHLEVYGGLRLLVRI